MLSVTVGIFSIVTTEILPIGLLTPIGSSFGISPGWAGLMMTMPGIVAAVAAPVVTVATSRIDRRLMLCVLMAVLALANLLAAVAATYEVMLGARFLVGLVIGGFWSIGAGLADRLVDSPRRATVVIFSAVPLGSVLGVPAGTFIGSLFGWRTAFAVLFVLTVGILVALVALLPPLPVVEVTRLAVLVGLLRRRGVWLALVVTVLIVTAHFGSYTYVTPFLALVSGVAPGLIGAFLLAYGIAGVAGNFLAGSRLSFLAVTGLLAGSVGLLPLLGGSDLGAFGLLVAWGVAYGAVPACSQALFFRAAPEYPEAATVLFTSSFQAMIAVGALLGGVVVDASSPSVVMLCGAGVAALAFLVLLARRRRPSAESTPPLASRASAAPPRR